MNFTVKTSEWSWLSIRLMCNLITQVFFAVVLIFGIIVAESYFTNDSAPITAFFPSFCFKISAKYFVIEILRRRISYII